MRVDEICWFKELGTWHILCSLLVSPVDTRYNW